MPIVLGALGNQSHQTIGTGTGGLENKRTSGDHPIYCIIEIGQNTEESPRDLRGLAVTQTPLRNHPLKLVWKTRKEINVRRTGEIMNTL